MNTMMKNDLNEIRWFGPYLLIYDTNALTVVLFLIVSLE